MRTFFSFQYLSLARFTSRPQPLIMCPLYVSTKNSRLVNEIILCCQNFLLTHDLFNCVVFLEFDESVAEAFAAGNAFGRNRDVNAVNDG